jgi:predicted PurR-regulated permease PerM
MDQASPRTDEQDRRFLRRMIWIFALVAGAGLAILAHDLLMLAFGAIVVGVILRTLAEPLRAKARLPEQAAVLVAMLALLGGLGLSVWLFGHQIAEQAAILSDTVPAAWARLRAQLESTALGGRVLDQLAALDGQGGRVFQMAPGFAAGGLSAVTNTLLIVAGGVMLALSPAAYRGGFLLLWPRGQREQLGEALLAVGRGLKLWLLGQFVSMLLIGVLTGLGLWIVGVPSPLALGLLAGLAQFVPVIGPLASSVPGLLLGASQGVEVLAWTLAVYVGVQQVESNLLTPFVQKKIAHIPMALTLFSVVGFGMLLGPLGVLFGAPLAVTLLVLVKALYIRGALGEDVALPGEGEKG